MSSGAVYSTLFLALMYLWRASFHFSKSFSDIKGMFCIALKAGLGLVVRKCGVFVETYVKVYSTDSKQYVLECSFRRLPNNPLEYIFAKEQMALHKEKLQVSFCILD